MCLKGQLGRVYLFYCRMKKEMYDTIDGRVLRCFEVIKKVGQGAYGQVWKARNKKTGTVCALKKIYEAFRNPSDAQKAYREIKYLQRLDHPNIIRLLGVHRPSNARDVYLQLQFMEADLCVALKNSVLRQIHKHYIFYQLANTLTYLHAADLVHRDIKPSNILVNETCEVKLCDFGLVRSLRREREDLVLTENIATRWYRAPEILLCSSVYGKPIDVWSMGCVLAEMVMGRPIFQGSSTISQLEKIFEVTGKPAPSDLDYLRNKSSLTIIENMEIKETKTIRELLNTTDKNIIDLLQRIFQVDPRKRPTAAEVLAHPFVSKFRGKVEQKVPGEPICILYDAKQLNIEDYKKLIYGDVDQKDFKLSDPPNTHQMIYKTLPNDLGRNNVFPHYPWGNLDRKSPLRSSNMNQKNLSPMGFRSKREEKAEEDVSQEKKKQRHSPSFLLNRKKDGSKSPIKGNPQRPPNEGGHKLVKKLTFPLPRRSPESPQKSQKNLNIPCSKQVPKMYSAMNFLKVNPEKALENDNRLRPIYELMYSQSFNESTDISQLKRRNTSDFSKSKEKKAPPKFILEAERRHKEATPNKDTNKERHDRIIAATSKSPIKSTSPFNKPHPSPHLQQPLGFKPRGVSPNSLQARQHGVQGILYSKIGK